MSFNRTVRRRLGTTATAVAAMTALTASQAPGITLPAPRQAKTAASDDVVWSEVPGDDVYHTELPPLRSPKPPAPPKPGAKADPVAARAWSEAGIPATVLAAYRKAEGTVRRGDPGNATVPADADTGLLGRPPGATVRAPVHPPITPNPLIALIAPIPSAFWSAGVRNSVTSW